ncbi:NAD(P)-dependent oxidoreductase [Nonomuraea jiangxiensis]|uniref:NAD binding domain of 6-phosphogluconate dehydrogenase n=1 Tax=Nonomuraea jiangxiensis TaxID=633440 RepID=A0A1G9KJE3_9ACTN|nr:NAD(P)-binding domain-containing protein [Nonomuraea jiangxiensis]SDL49634.1 NAD binding domain of 6-phosphogluconate dehydrogenase [Nonomuraea jiangxiensis]
MSENISVLGLGLMGAALARTLLAAGHHVTVWNRSPEKAAPLVAQGAMSAPTPAAAVEASPLVIACVLDYPAVEEVLAQAPLAGRVIANLTTGRPAEARETAARVAGRGGDYLDGGVMAVPQMIATPGALILYSGSRSAYDRYEQALGVLARPRYVGEDPGLAPLLDLAMLTGMYGQIAGFLEAVALVRSVKYPLTEFTSELLVPWLNAMAASQPRMATAIEAGDHRTEVSNLEVNRSGMENLVRAFEDEGVPLDLLLPMKAIIDRRVARGLGHEGLSGLAEELL